MQLEQFGWGKYHHTLIDSPSFDPYQVGRVAIEHKQGVVLLTEKGEVEGIVPRKFLHKQAVTDLPKVGDWVIFEYVPGEAKAVINKVLPRYTVLSRKEVGKKIREQIIATNIDTVFIVMGFDDNFNLARLERYLLLVAASGAQPVIILNKADLVDNPTSKTSLARSHAPGTAIIPISAKSKSGIDAIKSRIKPNDTVVFVGSSGVGKSTIINALLGQEKQTVQEVRESDSKGRHTTTRREIFMLPGGGILIDTPGMRELGSLPDNEALEASFDDIEQLGQKCKYRDCDHNKSDGCAIKAAVENGNLAYKRYQSYLKLRHETEPKSNVEDPKKARTKKVRDKKTTRALRAHYKQGFKNRR